MTTEEFARRLLSIADRHRVGSDDFDFASIDAEVDDLRGEPNFHAALMRTVQILEQHFPSVEQH
jgi:hypothetical protein